MKLFYRLFSFSLLIILLGSFASADTIEITGPITAKRTTFPYPFITKDGRVWECKFKVPYWTQDPDTGEWEWYDYKLYPVRGQGYEWTCAGLKVGQVIYFKAKRKKSLHKGDIVWLEVLS